ncbi:GCN5 family acetyltransferase [Hyella patelloides LEGE 07179]|uniref:GCN5 family acetyltransferase n=2 Tax=Hyella TaxID=945733 RepID=A0A563W1K4_9CYAN|nr:GCN5 family acetyltransferase [Hyella patelloides LEGE 07179]
MEITTNTVSAKGIKFSLVESDREIARAYLYLMHNDLHQEPFGLLEDVYVAEDNRGRGLGTQLVKQVIQEAREQGCYKLIATSRKSRSKVHQLYTRLGFQEHGLEFRIDF